MQLKIYHIFFTIYYFKALISLFVFSTRDRWVEIMHNGIDAVEVNQQVGVFPCSF